MEPNSEAVLQGARRSPVVVKITTVSSPARSIRLADAVAGTQALGEELCAPLYASSSLLGPSVTSAIASRTSVAVAAVASRDAINPQTWPPCAVRIPQTSTYDRRIGIFMAD